MIRKPLTIFLLLAGIALGAPGPAAAEDPRDLLIVVHRGVKTDTLNPDELRSIFRKLKTRWQGGGKIVPIHAKPGSSLRADFLRRVLNTNPTDEAAYWSDRKIRAGVSKPPEFSNPLKAVFNVNGSIGYVYRSDFKKGIAKVLLIIPAN